MIGMYVLLYSGARHEAGHGGGRLQEKGASDNQAEQLDVWLLRVVQFAAI